MPFLPSQSVFMGSLVILDGKDLRLLYLLTQSELLNNWKTCIFKGWGFFLLFVKSDCNFLPAVPVSGAPFKSSNFSHPLRKGNTQYAISTVLSAPAKILANPAQATALSAWSRKSKRAITQPLPPAACCSLQPFPFVWQFL